MTCDPTVTCLRVLPSPRLILVHPVLRHAPRGGASYLSILYKYRVDPSLGVSHCSGPGLLAKMVFVLAPATIVLLMMVLVAVAVQETVRRRRKLTQQFVQKATSTSKSSDDLEIAKPKLPPGPTPLPFIGNLFNLSKYEKNPYDGFSQLGKKFGPVYSLMMGSTPAVVVNTWDTIKEVLITKGNMFDARPDIPRFGLYFGGDRQHCKLRGSFMFPVFFSISSLIN